MTKDKVLILGAGLSGLSSAWHLRQKGLACRVFEKEKTAGGLCRSKKVKDFIFDYDGHLLHFRNGYTLRLVKKLLKGNLVRHRRSAWINNAGILGPYPFQANLYVLPKQVASECLWGFIYAHRNRPPDPAQVNFLEWINLTFGKGIARHFMVPYNQKFWTVPLRQMVCSWSDKFIPQVGLADMVNGFFKSNAKRLGYNAVFWYPRRGGIGQLAQSLEKQVGEISTNCCVTKIDLKNKEVVIAGQGRHKFDILVTTLPLPELVKILTPLPDKILKCFRRLRWNSIFNLNLGIQGDCQKGRHWIYFPHPQISFFRVGFFHNFSATLVTKGKSALYAEVSYSRRKPLDRKNIVKRILRDLKSTGIIGAQNKILAQDSNDIKYGYPVYDRHYFQAIRAIKEFLASQNIIVCGRYGSWQYASMEDALLDGKSAAQQVIKLQRRQG